MKKVFITLSIGFFILTSFNTGSKMTPVEYNDSIIGEQNKISKIMLEMANLFATDLNGAELKRQELVKQCESSIKAVNALPAYDGSTKFRDAGSALYSFYKEICGKEYKEMIDILKKTDIGEADIQRLTELEKDLSVRESRLDDAFQNAQKEFANKYNLELEDNKYQKDIDNLGK